MNRRQGALADIRVVDLTQMLAGPFATQLLADQGAEVIKVEPPDGDMARTSGVAQSDDKLAYGAYFQSVNRNKSSIVLDLKTQPGRDALVRLVQTADVLVENFRPGVMDRLGLSFESLREANPALVYATLSGFGDPRNGRSPYSDWPAFDVVAQAMGGMMGITGPDADTPMKVGPGIGDLVPGMHLAFGILAAVHHARRTGHGQMVDVSMVDSVLALCERIVQQHSYTGAVPAPEGNHHPFLCPFGLFRAHDGWVALGCPNDGFWRALTKIIGRPAMADDPRYGTNPLRIQHRGDVIHLIEEFTRRHTKKELMTILGGHVPFGPVYNVQDIFADPHFRAREMLVSLEHPGRAEPVEVAGVPVKLTDTPGGVYRRAPLLGEHTGEVLAGLGLDHPGR